VLRIDRAASLGLRVTCSPILVVNWYQEGALRTQEAEQVLARLTALGTVSPLLLRQARALLAAAIVLRGKQ